MQIWIRRDRLFSDVTLGQLEIEGKRPWLCETQEPPMRPDRVYVPGEASLPTGPYNCSTPYCRRFGRDLPLLVATSGSERRRLTDRVGMRIHPGHTSAFSPFDSCGEILLGMAREGRTVVRTKAAFDTLWGRLLEAMRDGEAIDVQIITKEPPP